MLLEMALAIGGTYAYYLMTNDKKPDKVKLSGWRELKPLTGDGVVISENVRLSPHFSNEHILICAPSGMKKTRGVIMPTAKSITESTLIITDPACEIEKECKGIHKNVLIFNPYSNNSIGYDPLKNCRTISEVKKIAEVILANGSTSSQNKTSSGDLQEWLDKAAPLLKSYMIWNWKLEKYSFDELIVRIVSGTMSSIHREIMNSNVEEAKIEFMSFAQVASANVTLSCIRSVLNTAVQLFIDPSVQKLFRKRSIIFDKLRDKSTVVFIQIPEKDADFYAPLTATFISQMLDRLIEKESGVQTYLLLDELCNIGFIPGLCRLLSTARKRGVSITGAIQSLSQLERVYGDISGKELKELFKTIVAMGGLKDSAEYFSSLLGNKEVIKDKVRHTEPVMTADEIRRLPSDKCLMICHNRQPVIDNIYEL